MEIQSQRQSLRLGRIRSSIVSCVQYSRVQDNSQSLQLQQIHGHRRAFDHHHLITVFVMNPAVPRISSNIRDLYFDRFGIDFDHCGHSQRIVMCHRHTGTSCDLSAQFVQMNRCGFHLSPNVSGPWSSRSVIHHGKRTHLGQ
jgi:hypothetical protein